MRVELHCHTVASWDGYSTIDDLIDECHAKQIDAMAVTEHDRFGLTSAAQRRARQAGVTLIPSCEVTTDKGFHVIGLFVRSLPARGSGPDVIRAIRAQGGLVSVPHPFKPGTGLMAIPAVDEAETSSVLAASDFIELYNGGYDQSSQAETIASLANHYGLRCVAASDAHRPWHVGMFVTELSCRPTADLRELCAAMKTASVSGLLRASHFHPRSPDDWHRPPRPSLFDAAIKRVPWGWRRAFHLARYRWNARGYRSRETTYEPCAIIGRSS